MVRLTKIHRRLSDFAELKIVNIEVQNMPEAALLELVQWSDQKAVNTLSKPKRRVLAL